MSKATEAEPQPQLYGSSYSLASENESKISTLHGDSDFLRAVSGKDSAAAWDVMDELMDTLKVVNGKAYDSVMRKISNIP